MRTLLLKNWGGFSRRVSISVSRILVSTFLAFFFFVLSSAGDSAMAQRVSRKKAVAEVGTQSMSRVEVQQDKPSSGFGYRLLPAPASKGIGGGDREEPEKGVLVNGEVYCAFTGKRIDVWLTDVVLSDEDSCVWNVNPAEAAKITNIYKGKHQDTVRIEFLGDFTGPQFDNGPLKVTISVSPSSGESFERQDILLYIPRKANTAADISVDGLIDEVTYCAGLNYKAWVAADPGYTPTVDKYNPENHPGASLNYTWGIAQDDMGLQLETTGDPSSDKVNMYQWTTAVDASQEGMYWSVTPRTCDKSGLYTFPTVRLIENVIPQELDIADMTVRPIRYIRDEMAPEPTYYWDTMPNEEYMNACVYYSDDFNTDPDNVAGGLSYGESNNGYIFLQAMPYQRSDVSYRHFAYEWIYDKEDLYMDTLKMQQPPYVTQGFSPDSARVIFKVKDRKDAVSNEIKVKFRAYCPECEEQASAQGKTLKYEKMSLELTLNRIDSIQGKVDYTSKITTAEGASIDGDVPKICGMTEYGLCNELKTTESGATGFDWVCPSGWVSAEEGAGGGFPGGPGTGGPGGAEDENCAHYVTPKVLGDANHHGDTVNLLTYPKNVCFKNGSDTSRNGKIFKVYLRSVPKAPVLIDNLESENPVYTGVDLVPPMGGFGDPTLPEKVSPVLLCNNNGLGQLGSNEQQYLLYNANDAVVPTRFDPGSPEKGGYGFDIKASTEIQTALLQDLRFLPYSGSAGVANDTNIMEFNLRASTFEVLKDQKKIPVGIFSSNECGPGDTAYFAINIIDTLQVFSHVTNIDSAHDDTYDTIALCEGVRIRLSSPSAYDEMSGQGYISNRNDSERNTDRVDYVWNFPEGWRFRNPATDSASNPTNIMVGYKSGPVTLAFKNRCGVGSARKADYVNVNPYTRVKIMVADPQDGTAATPFDPADPKTNPFLVQPCQGSHVIYTADTSDRTDRYKWILPSDWTIADDPNYGTQEKDGDQTNVAYTDHANLNALYDDMRVHVKVGSQSGNIYVVGAKEECGFTFDNFKPGSATLPLGHNRDSLYVQVRPFTAAPIEAEPWPAKLCARQVYTLGVMADTTQDSLTQEKTYFSWKFTEGWTDVDYNKPDLKDTVTFTVPDTPGEKDTIIVVSHRSDCDTYNEGDTLFYVFEITDTLSLDPASQWLDARKPTQKFNFYPCEGDTVHYILKGNNNHLDSIVWSWNDGHDFYRGDSVDTSGWRVLNTPGNYADTLKLVVGRAPLKISARAASLCGLSSAKSDSIYPVNLVVDTIHWVQSRVILCEDEKLVLQHDSVKNATSYQWFYPWGKTTDTLDGHGNVKREFSDKTEYLAGKIYVRPFNVCGFGPGSDTVDIKQVISRLKAPSVKGLNPDRNMLIVNDSTADTVCLRTEVDYKAMFDGDNYGSGTPYEGVEWRYRWMPLVLDPADVLSVPEITANGQPVSETNPNTNADSSQANFAKNSGFAVNYIGVAVHHPECQLLGDTLVIRVNPLDTVAIPEGKQITDYLVDTRLRGAVQLRPCGTDTANWVVAKQIHPSVTGYRFVWNTETAPEIGRDWNKVDSTMSGSSFKWLNPKDETDPVYYAKDTLYMAVGQGDSLFVSLQIKNRCGVSQTDSVKIRTSVKLVEPFHLELKTKHICDMEKLEFEVSGEQLDEVGKFIWHFPWRKNPDTTTYPVYIVEGDTLTAGDIYVIPNNGCGDGPTTNTVTLASEDIHRIPMRPEPANFDFSYDYTLDPIARDSICMNQPVTLKVKLPGRTEENKGDFQVDWKMVKGSPTGFNPWQNTDSCRLTQTSLTQDAFVLEVAQKVKVCSTYSDTLRIEIFEMDTISFLTVVPEDPSSLEAFQVVMPSVILNRADNTPIDLQPCGLTEQQYTLATAEDIHWSVEPDSQIYFGWSSDNSGIEYAPADDLSLAATDWHYVGEPLEPGLHYENLPLMVGNKDALNLHIRLHNVCGSSLSPALKLVPKQSITEKPELQLTSTAVCLDLPVEFQTTEPAHAEAYRWTFPWAPGSAETEVPYLRVERVSDVTGDVIVVPFNTCGDGPSDTLSITTITATPQRPLPHWREDDIYAWDADTIEEKVCLHGLTRLEVMADEVDNDQMRFKWAVSKGTSMEILPWQAEQPDSVCFLQAVAGAKADDTVMLMAWGEYPQCGGRGQTLYIRLTLIDTIPVASLGSVMITPEDVLPEAEPCPETVLTFSVQNDVALAYRWFLPSGWMFVPETDTTKGSVQVIVGAQAGSVMVAPMTDPSVIGCDIVSPNPLASAYLTPKPILKTSGFEAGFVERPCVGQTYTYKVQPTVGAQGYRWEVPGNWKIELPATAQPGVSNDSVLVNVSPDDLECTVTVGSDSGFIRVYALDYCDENLVKGTETSEEVYAIDTARLNIVGDVNVCIDSTLTLVVEAANAYADAQKYNLEIKYLGEDDTPVEIRYPDSILVDGVKVADSTLLEVVCLNSDSVALWFTPRNAYCEENVATTIHYIVADTIPSIPGVIEGPANICVDNRYTYTFHVDPEVGALIDDITYSWELPHSGWRILEGANDSTVVLYIDSIPSGRLVDVDLSDYVDTLRCYPRGFCGTAFPTIMEVRFSAPDVFDDSILVDNISPCLGTGIKAWLRDSDNYDTDTIKFIWNTPEKWIRLDDDSLTSTSYQVGYTAFSEVTVRYWRKGSCGLSETLRTRVMVRDSAAKVQLDGTLWPCYSRDEYILEVKPDASIDSVRWFFIPDTIEHGIYTSLGSAIKYDSVVIDNTDTAYRQPFQVLARSMNECGSRDTLFTVTPITGLDPFEDTLHSTRYCVGDTSFVYITMPENQRVDGTVHSWMIGSDTYRILADSVYADSVAVLEFVADSSLLPVQVIRFTRNDCAELEPDTITVSPFHYSIVAGPWKDTVVYMEDSIRLKVYSSTAGSTEDLDYEWGPANRLWPVLAEGIHDRCFTGPLVLENETFYVTSVQKLLQDTVGMPRYQVEGLCYASDTIHIYVDSLFSFDSLASDTICIDAETQIIANSYGGNREKYGVAWELLEDGNWVALPEFDNLEEIKLSMSEPGLYSYRVIGWDTTVLLALGSEVDVDNPDVDPEDPDLTPDDDNAARSADTVLVASHYDTAYVNLMVHDLQVSLGNVSGDVIEVPVGSRVSLDTRVEDGTGVYTYHWTPEEYILSVDSLTGNMSTIALFKPNEFVLAVTDTVSGCARDLRIQINMNTDRDIPNSFTPNGDGINDIFMREVDKLTIYSRWGDLIFQTTGGEGWDGTYKGKTVRPGEYLYVVETSIDGQVQVYKGVVSVILK